MFPPCSIVGYPAKGQTDLDLTFKRGGIMVTFPVWVVIGKLIDVSARNSLSTLLDGGAATVKTALESGGGTLGGVVASTLVSDPTVETFTDTLGTGFARSSLRCSGDCLMPFKHGRLAELWLNGVDVSTYFHDATFNAKVATAAVTTFKASWDAYIAGLANGNLTAAGYYDSSEADKVRSTLQAAVGQLTYLPAGGLAIGDMAPAA